MVSVVEIAQINLGLQVFLIILLSSSYLFKRKGRFFLHGSLMTVAVVLNAISFLLVMGPSLFAREESIVLMPFQTLSLVVVVHASLGSIAEILGVYVVALWRFRSDISGCARRKKVMLVTFVIWTVALVLGVLLYLLIYT